MAKHLAHGQHAAGTSSSSSSSKRLKRLDELRRSVPYCTKAALEGILEDVAEKGLPEVRTSKHMRLATDEALAECNQYGDLLLTSHVTLADGTTEPIKVTNLLSFTYKALQGLPLWRAILHCFEWSISKIWLCKHGSQIFLGGLQWWMFSRKPALSKGRKEAMGCPCHLERAGVFAFEQSAFVVSSVRG